MRTTGYNEIDLENWRNYPEIRTDSCWADEVNAYEHIYKRYTKRNDLVLNIFCRSESAKEEAQKLDRLYFEIENYEYDKSLCDGLGLKQKNIQLLLLTPDLNDVRANNDEKFFNTFKQFAKLGIQKLEQGRFVVLIIGNTYSNSTLHLKAYEYAQFLINQGLRLKSHVIKEIEKWAIPKPNTAKSLWHYKALMSGYNVTNFKNIFIFEK